MKHGALVLLGLSETAPNITAHLCGLWVEDSLGNDASGFSMSLSVRAADCD